MNEAAKTQINHHDESTANTRQFGLIGGVAFGLREILQTYPSFGRVMPNQGIYLAGRMALLVGALSTIFFGLASGLFFGLFFGLSIGLLYGLSIGLMFGFVFGLVYGGKEFVQHYLLRWMLARQEQFPRIGHLIPFLDAMARRILLIHAGAHYRFVHRMLQEHFASLSDKDIENLSEEIEFI